MRILLLYDNFIRDYRGLLLLQEFLKQMGHSVWLKATWDDPYTFCSIQTIQLVVTGQIAEWSTHRMGTYCKKNNIILIINTSEPVTAKNNFDILTTFNTHERNENYIEFQTVGILPHLNHIINNKELKDKSKYRFIGYPRTDISYNSELREVGVTGFSNKYSLKKYRKKYLFLSSFLLGEAFNGIPKQDLDKWNFSEYEKKRDDLLNHISKILKRFVDEVLNEDDILIIKKHPWDCSSYFKDNFSTKKCIILDNSDFITTCMNSVDLIIHTYSTAAFEAWVMNKPTVSIYKESYLDDAPLHMEKENIAFDYETFIEHVKKPTVVMSFNDDHLFAGKMDGNATYRLARMINDLKPRFKAGIPLSPKNIINRLILLKKYYMLTSGKFKYDVLSETKINTKMYDFLTWENERSNVNKLYKKTIRKFVSKTLN